MGVTSAIIEKQVRWDLAGIAADQLMVESAGRLRSARNRRK